MPQKHNRLLLHNTLISVIIVTYNDSDIIKNRLHELYLNVKKLKTNHEILVIDNGSKDNTVSRIRTLHSLIPEIRLIVLSKKYDISTAYSAGIDNCIGDYAVLLNIYTDPPRIISKCIQMLHKNIDIVIGKPEPAIYKNSLFANLVIKTMQRFSSHEILDPNMNLFALNRKAINAISRTRRKSRNLIYIHSHIGLKHSWIKYKPLTGYFYKITKNNIFQLIVFHFNNTISHSYRPIRLVTYLGMLFSSLFLLYVISIVGLFFAGIRIAPQGWITLSLVLGTLFFLLFLLLSILCEYIIRILHETRNEPFYYISEELDKSIILPEEHKVNIV